MQTVCPFKVPDEIIRKNAIGPVAGTPIRIKKALNILIPLFEPISEPTPSDWLWDHDEDGQTFDTYKSVPFNKVDDKRKVIYLLPLESNIEEEFLENLRKFTAAYFFGLEVKIKKSLDLSSLGVDSRINDYSQKIQYNASQILKVLEPKLPSDAYCMIGVCLADLYPKDEWNYVFGLASIKNRTGVFSFARYQEKFYSLEESKETETDKLNLLYRSCKVMAHEIGHMFGLRHCIYFNCLMNGINNLEENEKKPMVMCTVCIRKLQHNIEFQFLDQFLALEKICKELGGRFKLVGEWYEKVAEMLSYSYGPFHKNQIEPEKKTIIVSKKEKTQIGGKKK